MSDKAKQRLNDVYVIRPIAIFLLVVYHSFIIYMGGWKQPLGFQGVDSYWWLAKFSYSFMLELFVFISGYVLGLSLEKKKISFKSLLENKFKRLIIPSIIFSIAYYFLFFSLENFSILRFGYGVLEGCGHMWFLPMLFWVILIAFIIDKLPLPQCLKLVGVFCSPVLMVLPLPLRLSSAMYYLPFFYLGIWVYRKRDYVISALQKHSQLSALLAGVYVLLFIFVTLTVRDVLPVYANSESFIIRGIAFVSKTYLQLICAFSGVAFVYALVNYLLVVKGIKVPQWISELNATCFGVYLFQQFILQILYYKTSLPFLVGPYILPWVGLLITLILSYLLTKLSLKTKLGRELM